MDTLDVKLLRVLMENSKTPVTVLAKKVHVSREVATYRLNRLQQQGVILEFVTQIDIEKLGFTAAAVFINIKARRQQEFKRFLAETSFVSWVAELSGIWSFGFSIVGKTNEELDENFLLLYHKFKDAIIDHRFALHKKTTFFYEKYVRNLPLPLQSKIPAQKKNKTYTLDEKDKIILQQLSWNSRLDCVTLATSVSLSAPAVAQRIKHLEVSGYIEKYSLFVDVQQLGLFQYSIFVVNKNIDEKQKMIKYLQQHKNVSFVAEYVGDLFIEFGLFVKDPYELREKLQGIEETFPNNRVIEISLFQKEFVSVGPPSCVFE